MVVLLKIRFNRETARFWTGPYRDTGATRILMPGQKRSQFLEVNKVSGAEIPVRDLTTIAFLLQY